MDGTMAVLILTATAPLLATGSTQAAGTTPASTEGDQLRGTYGPYRANNDLLYYHLDLRVDPEKKYISGQNTIRFNMLTDGTRIQLELLPVFHIEKILLDEAAGKTTALQYQRAAGRTLFIDSPHTLKSGKTYTIEFYYSGNPVEIGRFGGFVFRKDPSGRPLVNTACEEEGAASVWWPNKDQWRDEVEDMDISVEPPSDLVEVSNGRFQGKTYPKAIHLELEGPLLD